MKVKGGGKRKVSAGVGGNPVPNDAFETNNDDVVGEENDASNNGYKCLDVNEDAQVRQIEKDREEREGVGQEVANEGEGEEQEQELELEQEQEQEQEEEEDEEEELPQDEAQDDRPKLDEGFYEIEAIRRRRVRKGQLQYLIKWRGWHETSNTWEPLENLQSCSDVIDAFEESLRSGKSSRKRKRKYGTPHTLSKKRQPRTIGQSLDDTLVNTNLTILPTATQSITSGHKGENNGDVSNVRTRRQANENRFANGSKQTDVREEETEYDPKLSELKGTLSTNEVNVDKLAIQIQESKSSEGNGLTHGLSKVDRAEQVQSNRRTGAKRRKSGSVKRFKQDLASSKGAVAQDLTPSIATNCGGTGEQLGIGNSSHKDKNDGSRNASAIVKIIKPIDFSASVSDNEQDVVVTFKAVRSDGKEVMVDNKFLKANDPLLLINFYEQHLKYSAQ